MSAIKDGRYPLTIGGKQRHLLFSLNALDEIQDKFGGYDKLHEVFNQDNKDWIKNTKWLLTMLINEGKDDDEPEVTEKEVGRMIHTGNILEVQSAILQAFSVGTSGDNEAGDQEEAEEGAEDGEDTGNATGGQER